METGGEMVGGEGFDQVALKKPRLEAGGAEQTTREGTQDQPQLEVEIVGTAQMKEQEILKRREALLEDSTMKLQRIYEVCMAQITEMAGQRSVECERILQSLHEAYVENFELEKHLESIRRSTLALFHVISQEPIEADTSSKPTIRQAQ